MVGHPQAPGSAAAGAGQREFTVNAPGRARLRQALGVLLSLALLLPGARTFAAKDNIVVRAYVNDTCIVADEPFFVPPVASKDGEQDLPKFLPLIGLVIGKLAELFINHEIQAHAAKYKSGVARKDTHYAVVQSMNLYRADFDPAPAVHINANLGCMTVVAGAFKAENTDCRAAYIPKELAKESFGLPQAQWKTSRTDDSMENQLRRANICIDGKARAIYESRFEFSADGTAYRLKNAGFRIDTLLTTDKAGATRAALVTLKITNPGAASDQQQVLSSAWVTLGTVHAGMRSAGGDGDKAPWLVVPPLSVEARRSYDEQTKVQQEVQGQIDALQRAMTRNGRLLTGIDQRIAVSNPDVAAGLKQERNRIAVQAESQSAELDARMSEYQELPRIALEFMPVTIEVGVTETESEKKTQLALAEIVGKNSDVVASAVGSAATDLLSKAVSASDLKLDPDAADAAGALQAARADYYDALIAARSSKQSAAQRDVQREKDKYNALRRAAGLEQLQ
jgi:hypothetical protein